MASRSRGESRAIGSSDDGRRACAGVRCAVFADAGAAACTGVITRGGCSRRDDPARAQARRSRRERRVANLGGHRLRSVASRAAAMIRIDALWLCTQPLDMRAGAERLMAHVVHALGSARAHHGYLFANVRATRIKLLVHDGFGVWCAARRLNAGRFVWPSESSAVAPLSLTQAQFDALVVGLPWERLPEMSLITRL